CLWSGPAQSLRRRWQRGGLPGIYLRCHRPLRLRPVDEEVLALSFANVVAGRVEADWSSRWSALRPARSTLPATDTPLRANEVFPNQAANCSICKNFFSIGQLMSDGLIYDSSHDKESLSEKSVECPRDRFSSDPPNPTWTAHATGPSP